MFSYFCPSLFMLCFMLVSAIWVLCNILYVFYGYALLHTCGLCFSLLYLLNLLQAREMLAVLDKFPHRAINCIMSCCKNHIVSCFRLFWVQELYHYSQICINNKNHTLISNSEFTDRYVYCIQFVCVCVCGGKQYTFCTCNCNTLPEHHPFLSLFLKLHKNTFGHYVVLDIMV